MNFREWWSEGRYLTGYNEAKAAWDYQQRRIDELEYELQRVHKIFWGVEDSSVDTNGDRK